MAAGEGGRYTVLLGAATPAGLPAAVFSQGEARWVGVTQDGQEADRTMLVSVPYALKAADAETLAGHPGTDFLLKTDTSTPVTQINVGSGITGGGTGPTVTLGLSSSYLESLGNSIYAQLGAANTFSSNMTVNGNLTVNGNVTAPKLVNSLVSLANTVYPQLAAANTFTGAQTFNNTIVQTVPGQGVIADTVTSTGQDGTAIYADATGADGTALIAYSSGDGIVANGSGSYGVQTQGGLAGVESQGLYFGIEAQSTNTNPAYFSIGVDASTPALSGMGVRGIAPAGTNVMGVYGQLASGSLTGNGAFSGAAVRGDSTNNTAASGTTPAGIYVGVLGTAAESDAGAFVNNSTQGYPALLAQANNSASPSLIAVNNATGGLCAVDAKGDLSCTGSVGTYAVTRDSRVVATYGVRSAEDWLEDFGSGQLASGSAHIRIAADFRSAADTSVEYHVFITPEAESRGLYVASRTEDGFEVREQGGGKSSVPFSYRIVARPFHSGAKRLEDVTEQTDSLARQQHLGRYALPARNTPQPAAPPVTLPARRNFPRPAMHTASLQ